MIDIKSAVPIDSHAIDWQFVRAGGPGGQHVNKSSTAAQLRLNVNRLSLPYEILNRFREQQKTRISNEGILIITSSVHRSQTRNREEAYERLIALITTATKRPKKRTATRPSRGAKARRLDNKKRQGDKKKSRSQKW